ncbi:MULTISPECIES: hypothetical protein [unclassified Thiomonas]|uniref:hypothetical protein n=1 Tax=unclassified Thiomonas TaxID=2625466 RepID=UPI0004DBC183|nr:MULTISPECIES: hypothetical protein [unclassified Thiomonas]CDW93432.1 conserved hypothetical protein [Thiomonas sp. CB2]VDY05162.1 conserved protein of unknown function [Thiomonas sp. Bio17B3]VDY07673.1 conserved protein of unknown function [Thiomonas sp. Sup16B3]VDY13408.1 conserved protein of unknown function [Thiomonas sp. OC7]VDY17384.1 conserved protein of unknown function [Thiomonas sp. CB2]
MATVENADDVSHINREAGDKQKGFRFQKLRAAIRFLEHVETNSHGQVFCAIEFLEDSLLYDGSADASISGEENKYYSSAVSFNSPAIKNTIVAFLDLHFSFNKSPELKLSVYASAETAQERITAAVRYELGYKKEQAQYNILQKLVSNSDFTDEEEHIAYHIVFKEYKKQYEGRNGGFLGSFGDWTANDFCNFLRTIEWSISTESNDALESQALQKVRSCKFFTHRHEALEPFILATLLDQFEKRSGASDPLSRLLSTDTLNLIYKDVLGSAGLDLKPADPAADSWDGIEIHDSRNLKEKILAVSPTFPVSSLRKLARKCTLAKAETLLRAREFAALRRRILDVCENEMEKSTFSNSMSPKDVNDVIDVLSEAAHSHFSTLSKGYSYQARDIHSIKGAVLTLFDDCYLAFDENNGQQQE